MYIYCRLENDKLLGYDIVWNLVHLRINCFQSAEKSRISCGSPLNSCTGSSVPPVHAASPSHGLQGPLRERLESLSPPTPTPTRGRVQRCPVCVCVCVCVRYIRRCRVHRALQSAARDRTVNNSLKNVRRARRRQESEESHLQGNKTSE